MRITIQFDVPDEKFDEVYKIIVNAQKQITPLFPVKISDNLKELIEKPITCLDFTQRIYTCLTYENIKFIKDLVVLTERELRIIPNLGKKSRTCIKEELFKHNLSIGMKLTTKQEKI